MKYFDPIRFRINQPQLFNTSARINFSLGAAIKPRGARKKDFNDEIRAAFNTVFRHDGKIFVSDEKDVRLIDVDVAQKDIERSEKSLSGLIYL